MERGNPELEHPAFHRHWIATGSFALSHPDSDSFNLSILPEPILPFIEPSVASSGNTPHQLYHRKH
jgi:hypothetical protein